MFESLRPDQISYMKKVIIYKPQKSPTQSGTSNTVFWTLESDEIAFKETDPLTGWKSDIKYQGIVKIKFRSLDDAINYAENMKYDYKVIEKKQKDLRIKSYADNFKYKRIKTEI